MTIRDIDTLSNLKKYGSFRETKNILKIHCGFHIKARSWKTLFEKIQSIKKIINHSDEDLVCTENFIKKLGLYSNDDNFKLSKRDFAKLLLFFTVKKFDPYEEFEKNKISDFKYSSKLEGIDIQNTDQTLDEIIAKYKVTVDG